MSAPNNRRRRDMVPVTAKSPCPVCKKPDWCLIAPDGTAAICARTESGNKCGDAGYLHRLTEPVVPPPARPKFRSGPKDWPAEATRYAAGFTPDRRHDLAERLRLPESVFDALPLIGVEAVAPAGPTFTFPECDATGTVIGINRRFPDKSKKMLPGGKRGLTLPDGWCSGSGPAFVVEGPTDALAMTAAGLGAIGRPSANGGAKWLAELLAEWPADRDIIVVGENDPKPDGTWPGRTGAKQVAEALGRDLGRRVRWVLPPDPAKDVRDWLTASDRAATPWADRGAELAFLLLAGADDDPPDDGETPGSGSRPTITIGTDEHRVNAEAVAALAGDADLYQRGGLLVHVREQDHEAEPGAVVRRPVGAVGVRLLARSLLRERLTRCAYWQQWRGSGENAELVPAHPPDWCIGAVYDRGDWPGVRRLDAVVPHPVLLANGTVLSASGFDPGSRILACIPPGLAVTVPESPTKTDVAAAVAALADAVHDFPFETPAHRAAWFAGLLTPLAWFLFDGPAPLTLIDGNVRGVGKGLLADVIALTLTGRRFPVMSYTNDRDELRKRITTIAIEGERLVLLDNLAGSIGNDVLDAALTTVEWKDRVLGANKGYDGPLHVCWYATGNNVQLGADTARRVCHVRMESPDERPETKANFRHPDLRSHVRANRGRLLGAALTILRGWIVAGRPTHKLTPWGSYEGWSGVVREAVVFAGLPDPGETRVALQTAADRDALAMESVLAGVRQLDRDRRGVTIADIIEFCKKTAPDRPDFQSELQSAVVDLCGKLDGRTLGYRFRHFARRNFGGWMLDRAGGSGGANRWVVLPTTSRTGPTDAPYRPDRPYEPEPRRGDEGDRGDVPTASGKLFRNFDEQMLPD